MDCNPGTAIPKYKDVKGIPFHFQLCQLTIAHDALLLNQEGNKHSSTNNEKRNNDGARAYEQWNDGLLMILQERPLWEMLLENHWYSGQGINYSLTNDEKKLMKVFARTCAME